MPKTLRPKLKQLSAVEAALAALLALLVPAPTMGQSLPAENPHRRYEAFQVHCQGDSFRLQSRSFFGKLRQSRAYAYIGYSNDRDFGPQSPDCQQIRPTSGFFPATAAGLVPYLHKGQWGLLNKKGAVAQQASWKQMRYLGPRQLKAQSVKGKWGLLGPKGRVRIPAQYASLRPVEGAEAFVASRESEKGLRFGVLGGAGQVLLPLRHRSVRFSNDGLLALRDSLDQWRIYRPDGQAWSNRDFQHLESFNRHRAIAKDSLRWGVLGPGDSVLVPFRYRRIRPTDVNAYRLESFLEWEWVGSDGQVLGTFLFDELRFCRDSLMRYRMYGREGLFRPGQGPLFTPRYQQISCLGQAALLARSDSAAYFIRPSGKAYFQIPTTDYRLLNDSIGLFHTAQGDKLYNFRQQRLLFCHQIDTLRQREHFLSAQIGQQYQLLGYDGRLLNTRSFNCSERYPGADSLLIAGYDDSVGLWNLPHQNWHLAPNYRNLYPLGDSLLVFEQDTVSGIINLRGRVRMRADSVWLRSDGYLRFWEDSLVGLFDPNGCFRLSPKFDSIGLRNSNGTFVVRRGKQWGIYSDSGTQLMPLQKKYDYIGPEVRGYYPASLYGNWGFCDSLGRMRIAARYQRVRPFQEGMAAMQIRGKWGFVDRPENIRVQPNYTHVRPFREGRAAARRAVRNKPQHRWEYYWLILDKDGNELTQPKFDTLIARKAGYVSKVDGQFGFVDLKGFERLAPRFDSLKVLQEDYLQVWLKGKTGVFRSDGQLVVPVIKDRLYFEPRRQWFLAGERGEQKTVVK